MRLVLLSSTEFGLRCLSRGIKPLRDIKVAGILTTPRSIEISYSDTVVPICTHADFGEIGAELGCEVVEIQGPIDSEKYLEHLEKWKAEFLLVLGWYYMIPRRVREFARFGCAGVHASLLPKYRGGAPINWAIINGEGETGVTFFYFDDGVDNGDIIAQKKFPIEMNDTCAKVYAKATEATIEILLDNLPRVSNGIVGGISQDENKASYYPQRKPEDGRILWDWDGKRIHDFIRAQTKPYPGAFTYLKGKRLILWSANLTEKEMVDVAPGTVFVEMETVSQLYAVCGDGLVLEIRQATWEDGGNLELNGIEKLGLEKPLQFEKK